MLLRVQFFLKIFFFTTIILLLIPACSKTSEEQQIRKQINNMQQAIADKSLSSFMSYFTKDFTGNKSLGRGDLKSLIFYHFKTNRKVATYKWQADITIKNKIALVEIYLVISGTNNSLPERGRIYTINSSWKNIENSWLVFEASWKDAILD